MSTATKTTATATAAVAAPTPTPAGEFSMVSAKDTDIASLRSSKRDSKYPALVTAFLDGTESGDAMEILNNDGSELDEKQVNRMYAGINNYKRYRASKMNDIIPISVRKAGNHLFFINETV